MAWQVTKTTPDGIYRGMVADVRDVVTKYGRRIAVDFETEDGFVSTAWFPYDFSLESRFVRFAAMLTGKDYSTGDLIDEADVIGKPVEWTVENGKVLEVKLAKDYEPANKRPDPAPTVAEPEVKLTKEQVAALRARVMERVKKLGLYEHMKLWWQNDRPEGIPAVEVLQWFDEMSDEEIRVTLLGDIQDDGFESDPFEEEDDEDIT